ncbi:glycoside hydrolase family 13 protein [Vagococcus humatus]|uniref:Alpha-glycosidase n=1 Tax=Vagococcus humatus TaxID=1889241 RepID=A0A3R9YDQ1_9ENTE|nr:glycoside hydrolase family 13 protein [Vagococcus humatus]RST88875.1 alpha-glycosidase [Vagococcus humatus]
MEKAGIYHRPESEFAYLYEKDLMHLRLRTKAADVASVQLIHGDPYLFEVDHWYNQQTPMKPVAHTSLYDYWEIEVTAPHRRLAYAFYLKGVDGEEVFYGDQGIFLTPNETRKDSATYFRMPYFQEEDRVKTPDWVKKTVWYQIFPERFANGDKENDPVNTLPWGSKQHPEVADFYGGDLKGIIDHLDYLEHLGVNGLYLCPVFEAKSNHKYDTTDYYQIDSAFGDKKLFKQLIDEAHQRGMRVMLDAVFNHIGYDSPQWQDVLAFGKESKYYDWFYIHQWPVETDKVNNYEGSTTIAYDTFSFVPNMPKLNTGNPEVAKYLLDIGTYWIQEFDIDGWRLDVANEVDHQFWKKFYQATTELKPDIYLLGEIWHSSQNWLNGDEFHAVMNYAYTKAIQDCFIYQKISVEKMIDSIYEQLMLYRKQTNEVMFNLLDSHDTPRLLTICNEDKDLAKQVLTFMFMQPGAPCIYYGTEIGLTGHGDPDCRKCMIWEEKAQDLELFSFMQQLIDLRKTYADLLSQGSIQLQASKDNPQLVILERVWQEKRLVAYFNISSHEYFLPNSEELTQQLWEFKTLIEATGLTIQPKGFVIWLDEGKTVSGNNG